MKAVSVPINEEWGSKFCRFFVIAVSTVITVFVLTFIGSTFSSYSVLIKVYAHIDHTWNTLGSLGVVSLVLLELAVVVIVITALIGIQGSPCIYVSCSYSQQQVHVLLRILHVRLVHGHACSRPFCNHSHTNLLLAKRSESMHQA